MQKLLKNLSTDKKPYPKDLLDVRRAAYLAQATSVVSSGPNIRRGDGKAQGGSPHAATPMTPVMKMVLAALIAANIALATYLAVYVYENWDKVQELLFEAPSVSETFPAPPEVLTQAPELETTPEMTISPEETVAPVSTPEPTSNLSDVSQPDSTPGPDGKDDPGKHLGQTPHSPDTPPGQNNQDDDQDKQDKDKDKKEK